jgi:hypothetical protein
VIADSIREKLHEIQPRGCSFRPVILARVVKLDWHRWDANADEPAEYPAGGEPEHYLTKRRHSPSVCSQLPTLWELFVPDLLGLQLEDGAFDPSLYSGQDICRGSRWGHIFVSDRFGAWIQTNLAPWVSLRPART